MVQILDDLLPEYHTVNVLKEPDIREGIKDFSNWPTIPQLYVDGKFVGGCDIVREMYVSGELQSALGVKAAQQAAPRITVSEAARQAIQQAGEPGAALRLSVSSKFEYELALDEQRNGDFAIDLGAGLTLVIDRMSAKRADGISIDYSGAERRRLPHREPERAGAREAAAAGGAEGAARRRRAAAPRRRTHAGGVRHRAHRRAASSSTRIRSWRSKGSRATRRSSSTATTACAAARPPSATSPRASRGVFNLDGGIDAWSQAGRPLAFPGTS